MIRRLLIVSLAVLLCTSAFGPAVVAGAATQTQDESNTGAESVHVTTGAQLSTLVTATSNEVRTEFENTAFEERLERSDDEARAAAIADRAAALENRSATLQAEYERATEAYEGGDIDESTYAQRLASLNARAQGVVSSYDRLLERADDASADALRAANVSASELREQRDEAARLTSTGTDALRRQFIGETQGEAEIEIETGGGVSIEAETEDGERSREFERPHDGGGSLNVSQADAREAATDALSAVNGSWTLEESSSDADDGVYEFEFTLTGDATGEAEVSVDGETGTVFALEEEIEAPEADEEDDDDERNDADENESERENDEREDEADDEDDERNDEDENESERENDDDDDAALETDATVENGTVTVTVTQNGSAVSGAAVVANDESVGTTGDDGTVSFAVPDGADELEIEVTHGELEGELELGLDGDERDEADDAEDGDDRETDQEEETNGDRDDEDDESTDEPTN